MRSSTEITIHAPYERIFPLAAEIEEWGRILPHYRYVELLRRKEDSWLVSRVRESGGGGKGVRGYIYTGELKLVKMSAWRNFVPVTWTAVQGISPGSAEQPGHIFFRHVRGLVRGMNVEWSFHRQPDGSYIVRITHDLPNPPMPVRLLGPKLIDLVVSKGFIEHIAGKTLKHIKELAEGESRITNHELRVVGTIRNS